MLMWMDLELLASASGRPAGIMEVVASPRCRGLTLLRRQVIWMLSSQPSGCSLAIASLSLASPRLSGNLAAAPSSARRLRAFPALRQPRNSTVVVGASVALRQQRRHCSWFHGPPAALPQQRY
jgi:hypothetical protein